MAEQVVDRFVALAGWKYSDRDLRRFEAGMQRARRGLDTFAAGATRIGLVLTGALAGVVSKLVSFESAFNELGAVALGATAEQMAELRQQALLLGSTTSKSATEAVQAQTELIRSGLSVNEAFAATPDTLNLAIAGNLEMAAAAQLVGAALKSYQLDADQAGRVTDVFAAVAAKTAFTVQGIGPAFRSVGALAASFGIEFEQTMAMLGTLRTAGLIPEQAGTALRNIIAILSEDPSDRVAQGFAKLGLNFEDVRAEFLKSKDVVAIMRTLATAGLDAQGALQIFGREAGNGAIILAESGAAVQALNDDLREVEGSADAMRETMEAGLPGAVAQIKSAFEGLMLALGDGGLTGIIERALNWVTGLIRWLTAAEPVIRKLIIAALLAGPALLGIGAAAKGISIALGGMQGLFKGVRLGMLLLTNPVGLIVTALGALAVAAVFLLGNWDRMRERLLGVWESITGGIGGSIERVQRWFRAMVANVKERWDTLRATVRDIAVKVAAWWDETAGPVVAAAWERLKGTVSDVAVKVAAWWQESAVPAITGAWKTLKDAVSEVAVKVYAWWQESAVPFIAGAWAKLKTATADIAVKVAAWWDETAVPAITVGWQWLKGAVSDIAVRVAAWWDDAALPAITTAWAWLKSTVPDVAVRVWAWWQEDAVPWIRQAWENLKAGVADIAVRVWAWWQETAVPIITAAWGWLKENVPAIAVKVWAWWQEDAVPWIKQAWADLKSTIADIAVRVWAWWQEDAVPAITAAWQWLRTAVTDIVVAVRAWWDDTAQPAIVASWQWLRDTVTAISVRVSAWWDETAQPAILAAWEWLKGTVTGIAVGVRAFWDGEGAERVRTAWDEFTAQFSDLWVTIRQRWVESTDDESRARMAAMWERISSGVQDFIVRVSVQGMEAMVTLVETLANIAGSIATIVNGFLRMTGGIKDAETASGEMLGPMDNLAAILERLPNPFAALEKVLEAIAWAVRQDRMAIRAGIVRTASRRSGRTGWPGSGASSAWRTSPIRCLPTRRECRRRSTCRRPPMRPPSPLRCRSRRPR